MRNSKCKIPILTCLLSILAILAYMFPASVDTFAFIPSLVSEGQWYRILTGQLVHLSFDHFIWDTSTFLILGIMVERRWRDAFLVCLTSCLVLIPWVVNLFDPGLFYYAGLSGIDCALFALLATAAVRTGWAEFSVLRKGCAILLFAALVSKLSYEALTGMTLFVSPDQGFEVVPIAHLAGALIGTASAFVSSHWVLPRRSELKPSLFFQS